MLNGQQSKADEHCQFDFQKSKFEITASDFQDGYQQFTLEDYSPSSIQI